ncbi:MAG: HEPN domain-containing protein [Nanoarchaeota archaeon]
MSKKNKLDWCLEKAQIELKEGKKHRGLVKKPQDINEARKHILKAEHNLSAISYFNKGGFSDWSMSAVFYCIYHCFLGIASKFGYESRNQECTIALIKYLKEQKEIDIEDIFIDALQSYNKEQRFESNIIEKRELYTYGTTISADNKEEIEKNIKLCQDCLNQTRNIIFK